MPTSIPVPQIKFGKTKQRSQMCDVFTIDGRLKIIELPVLHNCASDGDHAFILDDNNQYYCEDDKTWHQILDERDAVPLQLRKDSYFADGEHDEQDLKEIRDELFRISSERAQAKEYARANTNDNWDKLKWIFTCVFGSLTVISALVFLT
jgi:hypothetical protein